MDRLQSKIMKIALIVVLCSFLLWVVILLSVLFKYGILIVVGIIVLYLIFRKKKRYNPHRHHGHRRFRRR